MSRIWTQQPQVPVGIDWSNGLTKKACFIYSPSLKRESVNNLSPTLNSQSYGVSSGGISLTSALAGTGANFGTSRLITSDGAYTGDFSISVYANPVASGSRTIVFGVLKGSIPEAYLAFNGTAPDANSSGRFAFFWHSGNQNGVYSNSTSVIDGNWHLFAVRRNGGVLSLWVDGVAIPSTSVGLTGAVIAASTSSIYVGGYLSGGYGLNDRHVTFAMANNAAIDFTGVKTPWQIFAPLPSRIWVGPAAASGSPYTLAGTTAAYSLTGNSVTLTYAGSVAYTLTGTTTSFTETGNSATLTTQRKLTGTTTSFAETASTANLTAQRKLTGTTTSFSETGNTATLLPQRKLTGSTASIALTGNTVTLTHTVAGQYSLTGTTTSFTETGSNADLLWKHKLTSITTSVDLTGTTTSLNRGYTMSATSSSMAVTGVDANFSRTHVLATTPNSIVVTGFDATLYVTGVVLPTIARPSSDLTGTWSASDGGANKYAMINEVVPDNTTFIYTNTIGAKQRETLSAVADPGTTAGQVFSYIVWSPSGNGITVRLLNSDDSLIAEWIHPGPLPTTPPTAPIDQPLTPTQIAAIQSYSGIVLEVEAIN